MIRERLQIGGVFLCLVFSCKGSKLQRLLAGNSLSGLVMVGKKNADGYTIGKKYISSFGEKLNFNKTQVLSVIDQ